ncbi:MAG: hypothetical protein JST58_17640 [Bacteroidetes bacterium]|nr:hypothetical protein [Bacteroidota bacterium]
METKISQRQYAAMLGVSNTAIGKAIKAHYINKGFDKQSRKIVVSIANEEWGNQMVERKKTLLERNRKPLGSVSGNCGGLALPSDGSAANGLILAFRKMVDELQSLPTKCIDKIICSNNRDAAFDILSSEISHVIQHLGRMSTNSER